MVLLLTGKYDVSDIIDHLSEEGGIDPLVEFLDTLLDWRQVESQNRERRVNNQVIASRFIALIDRKNVLL
jgi:hypothetical protein